MRQILCEENTKPWTHIRDLVNDIVGPGRFEQFVKLLTASGWMSVDAFLEHRTEWLEVGKLAIAGALIPYEVPRELTRNLTDNGRWYAYLLGQLRCSQQDWHKNKLTVITYNYDRSLEHFLAEALAAAFRLDAQESKTLALATPIIHLHGQLGQLAPRAAGGRPYDPVLDNTSIRHGAAGIRIISEIDKADDVFNPARQALREAERVYFLGFGYAVENLNRLLSTLPAFTGHRAGTACGLGDGEKQEVSEYFGGRIDLGGTEESILSFLKRMPQLRTL